MRFLTTNTPKRWVAMIVVMSLILPGLAGCGSKGNDTADTSAPPPAAQTAPVQQPAPQKPGLSTKQKVVLLAGAALLFYIYQKDKSNNAKAAATGAAKPQLYREEKGSNTGAIYYRDPQTHKPVWVTAPGGGVNVPADPDALAAQQQYGNQPAPAAPAGAASVPATQYDPSLVAAGGPAGPSGPPGPGG